MGELSIHRWKGFELYPVINKKTVSVQSNAMFGRWCAGHDRLCCALGQLRDAIGGKPYLADVR